MSKRSVVTMLSAIVVAVGGLTLPSRAVAAWPSCDFGFYSACVNEDDSVAWEACATDDPYDACVAILAEDYGCGGVSRDDVEASCNAGGPGCDFDVQCWVF